MKSLFKLVATVAALFFGTIYALFAACLVGCAACAILIMYRGMMAAPSMVGLDILQPVRVMFFLAICAGILGSLLGGLFGRFR